MTWPPDRKRPAYRDGQPWAIQGHDASTVSLVRESDGHATTASREEYTQHWTQEAPTMTTFEGHAWRYDSERERVVDDSDATVCHSVDGVDGIAIAALPDMARALWNLTGSCANTGSLTNGCESSGLPLCQHCAGRAALTKAGVLK